MIEPLRFATEKAPPHVIDQAVFCGVCLADRKTRKNPKIASKYCHNCFKNNYMCLSCDAKEHGLMKTKHHIRSLIVVGPPVRKKVLNRGDAVNFPMFLDHVKIKYKARVFDDGKIVHREPVKYLEFQSGLSGDCVHVQVLGCKNLMAADVHGSSDPFITGVYCGMNLGTTRTRHRTLNPKWTNETFVVPVAEDLPPPREESFSQKNLLRLEVYDRDYFTSNDFLGHIELSRKRLIDIAEHSKGKSVTLPLTARHHHGTISVRLGSNLDIAYIKIVGGESLEKTDGFGLSDPFCKVYFKGRHLGTTHVCANTVTPTWSRSNVFAVPLADLLDEEERILAILKEEEQESRREARRGAVKPPVQSFGGSARDVRSVKTKEDNDDEELKRQKLLELNSKSLFVIELYDYNRFNPSQLLGHVRVPVEALRKLIPILPGEAEPVPEGGSVTHMIFRAKSATGKYFRNEKASSRKSIRVSGKSEFSSAKIEEAQDSSPYIDAPDANSSAFGPMGKKMSAKVGDISDALVEESEEDSVSTHQTPPRAIAPADPIGRVSVHQLLGTEVDGSSYASGSDQDHTNADGSVVSWEHAIPSAEPSNTVVRGHSSSQVEEEGDRNADLALVAEGSEEELLAPSRRYSSLSNRPVPPSVLVEDDANERYQGGAINNTEGQSSPAANIGASHGSKSPKSPTTHGNDKNGGNGNSPRTPGNRSNGDMAAEEEEHDVIVGDDQYEEPDDHMYDTEGYIDQQDDYDDDLPAEMLSEEHDSDEEYDDKVPNESMRDRGQGTMGEDGVYLESDALLGDTIKKRRRSSVFGKGLSVLGFAIDQEDEDEDKDAERMSKVKKKLQEKMSKMDYNTGCFKAIRRLFFGEVRWSKLAYFPVMKYKLTEDDLDVNRGEICLRVLRSNRGKTMRGLDSGVRNMSLGETAVIKVRYDRAYSSFCLGTMIPPRANIVFTVELLRINGRGGFGMPWRQVKRVFRFFWRYKEMAVNSIERAWWRAVKRYKGVVEITGPPDSYYMEEIDESSLVSSVESLDEIVDDDDEEKVNPALAGVHLGGKLMWGFAPEKRPVKAKKQKTAYEKLLEKQSRRELKRTQKLLSQRRQVSGVESLEDDNNSQLTHDRLLNMGLGEQVDLDYQLADNDSMENSHGNDMQISEIRSTDGRDDQAGEHTKLQLDLDNVKKGVSVNSSASSRKKSKSSSSSKRRQSQSADEPKLHDPHDYKIR